MAFVLLIYLDSIIPSFLDNSLSLAGDSGLVTLNVSREGGSSGPANPVVDAILANDRRLYTPLNETNLSMLNSGSCNQF